MTIEVSDGILLLGLLNRLINRSIWNRSETLEVFVDIDKDFVDSDGKELARQLKVVTE